MRRLRLLFEHGAWSRNDVVEFHSREKFFLLSHSTEVYRELGRLVGAIGDLSAEEFALQYQDAYLRCIAHRPSLGKHQNVLDHMAGFFKHPLRPAEKAELREAISPTEQGRRRSHCQRACCVFSPRPIERTIFSIRFTSTRLCALSCHSLAGWRKRIMSKLGPSRTASVPKLHQGAHRSRLQGHRL